jgi:hypothetical protein
MELLPEDPDRRHALPYPMELGSPAFQPIAIAEAKDLSINTARAHAQQEYDRIMEQAAVLIRQAQALQDRLTMSERVIAADWGFAERHGTNYYLYLNTHTGRETLSLIAPADWQGRCPDHLQYQATVQKQGDSTWAEVTEQGATHDH